MAGMAESGAQLPYPCLDTDSRAHDVDVELPPSKPRISRKLVVSLLRMVNTVHRIDRQMEETMKAFFLNKPEDLRSVPPRVENDRAQPGTKVVGP